MTISPKHGAEIMNLNNRKDVSERTKLKILDIKVSNTDTADPFGGVMFGHLYVEGRIRLLTLVDKQDGYSVSLDDPKIPRPDYPKLCLSIGPVGSRGWGAMIIEPSMPLLAPTWPSLGLQHPALEHGNFHGRTWGSQVPSYERNISVDGMLFRRVGYWQCTGDEQFMTSECNPFWNAPVRKIILI